MRKAIIVVLACSLAACGGRAAHPVMIQQYGDRQKSCEVIEVEMAQIQQEINRLIPKTKKTGKNTALAVAGWFLIVPFFFMDLSEAEQEEIEAYRKRYNHLLLIATDKKCGTEREVIPEFQKKKGETGKPQEKEQNQERQKAI